MMQSLKNAARQAGVLWLLLIPLSLWFVIHYQVAWNKTNSLPEKLFVVRLKKLPSRNDYVLFYAPSSSHFHPNETLIKKVIGVAGDKVTQKKQMFYINNQAIGLAKTHSLQGRPLMLGPTGIIPQGKYFVWTPHVDSYDSRYQEIGWIDESAILGVAYPLF